MKKKVSIFLVCMMAAMFLLTACGKDMSDSKYVGTWVGTTAEYEGMELSVEELFGEFSITLEADGTAKGTMDGEEESGKWEETDNGVSLDGEMELIADGEKLTYEEEGVIIYFEKK
ncbi:hypothetical protein [Faecalicatena contorta]|uniref:hypothetical protein n=1 Tax=Faecalicatena contorta TaxID=39482 RepID=UPI001F350CCE|nr:hypothetical protein [Faecalicatena contorta]MCF2554586.1 hypothetical protein [Faecalicatena contorta]MCF2679518.1 hypothetical protein [Faecalicatena contorta]